VSGGGTEVMQPLVDRAERLSQTPGPATAALELVAASGGHRDALEAARAVFIDRLQRASDDYDASTALALVYRAINALDTQNLPEGAAPKPARRWSQRWRAQRRHEVHDHDRATKIAARARARRRIPTLGELVGPLPPDRPVPAHATDVDTDPWALDRAADDGWPPTTRRRLAARPTPQPRRERSSARVPRAAV
jgi:hypothetical protein